MAERSDITCPRLLSQPVRLQKIFLSPISSLTLQLAPASNPTQLHPFLKHLSTLLGLEGSCCAAYYGKASSSPKTMLTCCCSLWPPQTSPPQPRQNNHSFSGSSVQSTVPQIQCINREGQCPMSLYLQLLAQSPACHTAGTQDMSYN